MTAGLRPGALGAALTFVAQTTAICIQNHQSPQTTQKRLFGVLVENGEAPVAGVTIRDGSAEDCATFREAARGAWAAKTPETAGIARSHVDFIDRSRLGAPAGT